MSNSEQKRPRVIPIGLKRCPTCGEYRGKIAVVPSFRHDFLEIVPVRCLCDGISRAGVRQAAASSDQQLLRRGARRDHPRAVRAGDSVW
jgi:hypothetical protein